MNYFNENNREAAAWLRELINAGVIAPGVVDERSIEDVRPGDLRGFTQCHFFAGIGVWSYALRRAGWADDRRVWTGSCPCQPFSQAGEGHGFDDERHLWPTWFQLIAQCRPDDVLGEQVASKDGLAWLDLVQTDMEAAGYAFAPVDLCAAGVGAPHIRQRLWFVATAHGGRLARVAGLSAGRLAETRADLHRGVGGALDVAGGQRRERRQGSAAGGVARGADAGRLKGQHGAVGADEAVGLVVHAGLHDGAGRAGQTNGAGPVQSGRPGDASGLADHHQDGRAVVGEARLHGHGQPGHDAAGRSPADGLADAQREGLQVRAEGDVRGALGHQEGRLVGQSGLGGLSGPWADADWIFCRDGKWRPVEPGTSPLAHGAPARVGRLRGYGNAIVAEAAVAVIEAYREVIEA